MPPIPSSSPITGKSVSDDYIHTTSCCFVDNHGRSLLLRGVNLSGASKAPVGHLSYLLEDFWESAEAGGESFVGRPLNIDDGSADVHLARLRGWGFNMLRFPFTWEAIEHEGPGKFDTEFMDYTIRVLCKCRDYGFRVFMDPHQDTWSRFSGGSGAPFWTLAACGINPRHITATQAAIIHSEYPLPHEPDPANLPAMVWSTNYGRLLSQTVFTLFFAGRTFAPNCIIDGLNIQDYLQQHFIESCGQLADRIRDFDNGSLFDSCIIGWDSMNEPFEGLCGWFDLQVNPTAQGSTLKKGTYPTPAQSLRLGMGQAQTVENWTFGVTGPSKNGTVTIDPKGRKVWADPASSTSVREDSHEPSGTDPVEELPDGTHPRWGWKRDVSKWPLGTCVWAQHGVWDIETGFILRPHYFYTHPKTGEEVEFLSDFWKPHWIAYANRIRQAHEEAIVLVQPPVFAPPPRFEEEELKGRCIYSPHYYDGLTLITRHWNWFNADALGLLRGKYSSTLQAVKIGERAIRNSLHQQLGYLQDDVPALGNGDYPTLIGEIGSPFDMDGKRSYGWTDGGKHKGDYSAQEKALDASLNACDARLSDGNGRQSLNWTVWTYVPDDHTHEWGDGWNMEDLSLWSPDDLHYGDTDDEDDMDDAKEAESLMANGYGRNSRAKLLRGDSAAPRKLIKRAPAKSRPMALARASLSFASLGGASIGATSIGLGLTGGVPLPIPPPLAPFPPVRRLKSMDSVSTMSVGRCRRGAGWSSDPYTFLTNGARAVRAFARPWPVCVVGRAVDVRFDIPSGVFKLRISVGWEDRIRNQREGEDLVTEVYVPLVHYAHPRLLEEAERSVEKKRLRAQGRRWSSKERGEVQGDGRSLRSTASESGDSLGEEDRERGRPQRREIVPPLSLSMMTTTTTTTNETNTDTLISTTLSPSSPSTLCKGDAKQAFTFPPPDSLLSKDSCTAAPLLISDSTADLVDIIVTVSEGQVEVRGQKLLWRYDVPQEGAPRREYTLEVRRRGGALKTPPSAFGRRVAGGPLAERNMGEQGWCERLCPEDGPCVIA